MSYTLDNGEVLVIDAIGEHDGGNAVVNNYQLLRESPGTISEGAFLEDVEEWLTFIYSVVVALQSTIMIWKGFQVSTLAGTYTSGFVPFAADIPGEVSGDTSPSGVAALVYFPTGVKRKQLRKYFGTLAESAVGALGGLSSGTLSTLGDLEEYFLDVQSLSNGSWVFGHRSAPGEDFHPPVAMAISAEPAYQRRRKRGRGA